MRAPDPAALAAVVLAAGEGRRLLPLTELRPKPLCPLGLSTGLDDALGRLAGVGLTGPRAVAVNAHHHAAQLAAAVGDRAHLSVERPEALGTAGAVGALADWIGGRAVVISNADAYLAGDRPLETLLAGWTGERPRLLTVRDPARGDFGDLRFAGISLLPAAVAARLSARPTGLYEVVWRDAYRAGQLELIEYDGTFVDCGTPRDYLTANLHAAGAATTGSVRPGPVPPGPAVRSMVGAGTAVGYIVGTGAVVTGTAVRSVIGTGAIVAGSLTRSVVWPGGRVAPGEHLVDAIRTDTGVTVQT
jgi:N-acetyl-alpha-D-muramate 1-phosphate uridylyltransferase